MWSCDFLPEDRGHGWLQRHAQIELIEAEETARGIEDSVVVVHCYHEAAGEGMAVDEGDCWHWVCQKLCKKRKHAVGKEPLCTIHMLNIQSIAVEFWDAGGGDDNARRIGEFYDVEG